MSHLFCAFIYNSQKISFSSEAVRQFVGVAFDRALSAFRVAGESFLHNQVLHSPALLNRFTLFPFFFSFLLLCDWLLLHVGALGFVLFLSFFEQRNLPFELSIDCLLVAQVLSDVNLQFLQWTLLPIK